MTRLLSTVAQEIMDNWPATNVTAMLSLRTMRDRYSQDSAHDIVLRFLCNASTWRGPVARRVKNELNAMLRAEARRIEHQDSIIRRARDGMTNAKKLTGPQSQKDAR